MTDMELKTEIETEIIRSGRKTVSAQIKNGKLIIRAPYYVSDKDIERFISRSGKWIEKRVAESRKREEEKKNIRRLTADEITALAVEAKKAIPQRVAYYAPIIGVKYGGITIRKQKSRWGSCTAKGNLSFNCLLMLAPPEVLDSVVVHELCHRKEMNHSKKFYAEILRVMPEYYERRKWLKENGELLQTMAE